MTEVATRILGPVSEVLEAEVRGWLRSHGVVVGLDRDDRHTGFEDRSMRFFFGELWSSTRFGRSP